MGDDFTYVLAQLKGTLERENRELDADRCRVLVTLADTYYAQLKRMATDSGKRARLANVVDVLR
ncbi:MAG: hypothetical protein ACXQS4_05045 [Methermicoccaceae archaeon]